MVLTIIAIAAVDQQMGLGSENKLLTHLPKDLAYFKKTTQKQTVVMGRKTYESIGRPLPGRENIILSRQQGLKIPGCMCVNSLEQAIKQCKTEKLFIIGGGEIYAQAMPFVHQLLITRIHHCFDKADTFFPAIDETKWQLKQEEHHVKDEKHAYDFSFLVYELV